MHLSVGNIIDVIMAVSFVIAIVRGWHTGLVIKLAHLAAVIASCALANVVANMLKSSVGSKIILPVLEEKTGEEVFLIPYAKEGITFVAENVAYYLVAFVCFLLTMIILYQLIKVLHVVDHVPIVGKINKAGGALVGFLIEFIFFYIICMVVFNVIPSDTLEQWGLSKQAISQTYLLQAFVR